MYCVLVAVFAAGVFGSGSAGVFAAGSAERRAVVFGTGGDFGGVAVFADTSFFGVAGVAVFFGGEEAGFFAGGGGVAGGLGLDAGGVVPAVMVERGLEQKRCQLGPRYIFDVTPSCTVQLNREEVAQSASRAQYVPAAP